MNELDIQFAGAFGPYELLVIFGIVVLLFGGSKLPVLGRSLGEGINNFKKSFKSPDEEEITVAEVAPVVESSPELELKTKNSIEDQSGKQSENKSNQT